MQALSSQERCLDALCPCTESELPRGWCTAGFFGYLDQDHHPDCHPSQKARQWLTYTKSLFQPGQLHVQPEFILLVDRAVQVPRYKVPGFLLPRSTLISSLPSLPYIFHLHLFFPVHQAQVFCSGAMLLCLNCSDNLPDMLLLLSWEGARVLSAEPQDSFLANILSVAGLFEYPGKSSTNCRLARHVPKKQFYQNFWQKKSAWFDRCFSGLGV